MELKIRRLNLMRSAAEDLAYIHVTLEPPFADNSGLSGEFTAVVSLQADLVMSATLGELKTLAAQQIRAGLLLVQ